jgi:hypothetical protein
MRSRLRSWPLLVGLVAVVGAAVAVALRSGGSEADLTPADKRFSAICRAHGGEPSLAPGSGDYVKDARGCTVRYPSGTYEMYAVHEDGWSATEAAAARRTCVAQARQARAARARGERISPVGYVWHERSGICEELKE